MAGSAETPADGADTQGSADDGRPLSIAVAAGVLVLVGTFTGLVGAVLIIAALVTTNPAGLPDYLGVNPSGFFAVAGGIGMLLMAYGTGGLLAGIHLLRRRAWARAVGIGLAAIGVVALVAAMLGPGQTGGATPVIFAPVIAALAYAIVALATERHWFEASTPGTGTG